MRAGKDHWKVKLDAEIASLDVVVVTRSPLPIVNPARNTRERDRARRLLHSAPYSRKTRRALNRAAEEAAWEPTRRKLYPHAYSQ